VAAIVFPIVQRSDHGSICGTRRRWTVSVGALGLFCTSIAFFFWHAPSSFAQNEKRPPIVEVRLLDGSSASGALLHFDRTELAIRGADGSSKRAPLEQVLEVQFLGDMPPLPAQLTYATLELIDGTKLLCPEVHWRGQRVEVRLLDGRALQFSMNSVHSFLPDAQDRRQQEMFAPVRARQSATDRLCLLSRDGNTVNVFEGTIGAADPAGKTIRFQRTSGSSFDIAMERVRGLVFSRPEAASLPAGVARLQDRSHNHFVLAQFAVKPEALEGTTCSGLVLDLPLEKVHKLDLSLGKLAYLSDLEPLFLEETPILADLRKDPRARIYQRDRTLDGGPLVLGRKVYSRGLALHSRTVIVFSAQGYRRFQAIAGFDDGIVSPAQVVLRIEADGRSLFEKTLHTGDQPVTLDLSLGGAERLRIVVDYGDDLDLGDHVILADARLVR